MSSAVESAPSPAPRAGRLEHLGLLRLSGPDGIDFLQGQVSNDTRPLAQGAAVLAAYSTAQGRVIAVLRLLPHSSGVVAILPRALVLPVLERLRKFVLRAKVKLEDVSAQFEILGAHGAAALEALSASPPPAPGASFVEHAGTAIARVAPPRGSERFWVVRPVTEPADPRPDEAASAERAWRLADIRDGLPQVYPETSEAFVAQMLNLDLLDGISFSKGCYTGQEIIARTQNLGRIKRRMSRLRLPAGSWSIGQSVRLADGRAGRLTELAPADGTHEALAVLSLDAGGTESEDAAQGAVDAEELPLPYAPA
jgi:tRNA-modifying protein YgfZ